MILKTARWVAIMILLSCSIYDFFKHNINIGVIELLLATLIIIIEIYDKKTKSY